LKRCLVQTHHRKQYGVKEQAVIQYIIDKTEYETTLDIINGNKDTDSIGNK
jgi:hypothetical protein